MAHERSKKEEGRSVEPRKSGQLSKMEPAPTWTPFSIMRKFADEMDRMFEGIGLQGLERKPWAGLERFSPKIDVFEREGKFIVRADLPGMSKDDLKVDITDDGITLEGERKYEHEENEKGVYRSERSYGRFTREIPLPDGVNADTAKATFKNGVLEISMEAPETTKAHRRIEISGEEPGKKPGQSAA
jgi:HSP20 family protein